MKSYGNCDMCRLAGILAMVASIVLGLLFSVLLSGFGLLFFGVTFVIGLLLLVIGTVFHRSSPKAAATR